MLIGMGAKVEREGPGRCGKIKSRDEKSFAGFPYSLNTLKEKSEKKTGILSNHTTKNFIGVLINSIIGQLVFPLLFPLSILWLGC